MTWNLQDIIASKQEYSKKLAQLPIAEKLAMLDKLRERTLSIRNAVGRGIAKDASTEPREHATQSPSKFT